MIGILAMRSIPDPDLSIRVNVTLLTLFRSTLDYRFFDDLLAFLVLVQLRDERNTSSRGQSSFLDLLFDLRAIIFRVFLHYLRSFRNGCPSASQAGDNIARLLLASHYSRV